MQELLGPEKFSKLAHTHLHSSSYTVKTDFLCVDLFLRSIVHSLRWLSGHVGHFVHTVSSLSSSLKIRRAGSRSLIIVHYTRICCFAERSFLLFVLACTDLSLSRRCRSFLHVFPFCIVYTRGGVTSFYLGNGGETACRWFWYVDRLA